MDEMRLKFYTPVVTGTPVVSPHLPSQQTAGSGKGASFQDVLRRQLEQSGGVTFSKHAMRRAAQSNVDVSAESIARLNEGVRLAGERNLDDTLILVDKTAFLVNVRNNTVITAMGSHEMKGNVFTNIDGTVIM